MFSTLPALTHYIPRTLFEQGRIDHPPEALRGRSRMRLNAHHCVTSLLFHVLFSYLVGRYGAEKRQDILVFRPREIMNLNNIYIYQETRVSFLSLEEMR